MKNGIFLAVSFWRVNKPKNPEIGFSNLFYFKFRCPMETMTVDVRKFLVTLYIFKQRYKMQWQTLRKSLLKTQFQSFIPAEKKLIKI